MQMIEMRDDLAVAGVEIPALDAQGNVVDYVSAGQLVGAKVVGCVEPHYFVVDLSDNRQLYFVSSDFN